MFSPSKTRLPLLQLQDKDLSHDFHLQQVVQQLGVIVKVVR